MHSNQRLAAIAFACASFALFAVMSAFVKHLGGDFSTIQIIFFRSLFALLPLVLVLRTIRLWQVLRIRRPGLMGLRALMGLLAMVFFFAGVTVLPLAEVVALAFAAPIFTTMLGTLFLGEKVGIHRWSAVVIGLVGVVVMVRPGSELFTVWSLLPLASAVFYSLGVILVRTLSKTEAATSIVLYFSVISLVVSGVAVPFQWHQPNLFELVLLGAMGITGGVMQLCSANAIRRAEVTVLAPFEYTSLLWSTLLGYLFWDEFPGAHLWLGAFLVCSSVLYIVYREGRVKR
jgi:drug/metabolite transporter (DMT)-like permease